MPRAGDVWRSPGAWPRVVASVAVLSIACRVAAQDPRLTNPVADTVYVTYNIQASQGVAAASAASAESQYVAARVVPLATGDGAAGNLPLRPGETPEAAAARYRKVPGVLSAAPELWAFAQDASGDDGVAASDTSAASPFPYYAPTGNKKWDESWAMVKTSVGYVWGRGVGGRSVDTAPSKDGDETRVCIIDSGVDCEHPELKPMCADGAAFVHNRAPQLGLQYAQDESGHGTYMAGLVAAAANDKGMAGMLYKGSALYVCKFMDGDGVGYISNALQCLRWCISKNVALSIAAWGTNLGDMEWDGPDTVGALYWQFQEEMKQQGQRHLLVTAAGNHGRQLREQKDCRSFFFMPAQLKLGNMVVVGATDETDDVWREGGGSATGDTCSAPVEGVGSNYGSRWVDIMAPGRLVWTTRLRTAAEAADGLATYKQVSGTSVATALVGGAAGLILARTWNWAAEDMVEVRVALLEGCDSVQALSRNLLDSSQQVVGGGCRLNAYNALAAYYSDDDDWPWLPPGMCGVEPPRPPPSPSPPPAPRAAAQPAHNSADETAPAAAKAQAPKAAAALAETPQAVAEAAALPQAPQALAEAAAFPQAAAIPSAAATAQL
ncbi:hypothetical protein CHLNCDRAFT_134082 [Chlorella variabilis]|uniref:Peptidase S8/S53 domain-containing protein n=1 Tax=Chlorella variabilis TaxID=554065 RepID=E1ZEY9_CHLVA|nr:hypothetical protein CHLNCDRAFT_134082 [Chlorella variabilis]EFN55744.1 hypothetical protein CHLNCDRAFT_134082 [Chlorella variabilis]|eukprot:XP_005847846.1 hypothetical protein CHLNCDRAFT_134082 [Chlorella variabilis]